MVLQFVYALLYRWLLPVALLGVGVTRLNAVSLVYLVVLLLCPLVRSDQRSAGPRFLVTTLLLVSTASLLGNAFFQLSRATNYADDQLQPGDAAERIWRQIGLNQMKKFSSAEVARHIVPDVAVCLLSVVLLAILLKLRKGNGNGDGDEGAEADGESGAADRQRQSGVPKWLLSVVYAFSNALCLAALVCAGAANPSLLSAIYILVFVVLGVCWALNVSEGEAKLRVLKRFLILYSALHFLALYLYQFEGIQSTAAWDPNVFTAPQALGLTPIVNASYGGVKPWRIVFSTQGKWTWYLSPALIFTLFWVVALDRQFAKKSQAITTAEQQSTRANNFALTSSGSSSPARERSKLLRRTQPTSYGTRSPPQERPTSHSPPPSMPLATADAEADDYHVAMVPEEGGPSGHDDIHPAIVKMSRFFRAVGQFCMQYSYLAMLIVMMAWSIAYLSYLSCVFLIVACILWIVPNRFAWCLRMSPLIVAYAGALLILEYICDFDIVIDTWYNWEEMGVSHHRIGFGHVLLKAAGVGIFLTTVKCYTQWLKETENSERPLVAGHGASSGRSSSSSGSVHDDADETDGTSRLVFGFFELAFALLCQYWLLVCYSVFVAAGLIGDVSIFRMLYMLLFLIFFVTYQLSGRLWSAVVRPLWWLAVLYSMAVLGLVYSYQFETVRHGWDKVNRTLVEDIGLEKYDQAALFRQLLLPTLVLIVVIIQIQYCHGRVQGADTNSDNSSKSASHASTPAPPGQYNRLSSLPPGSDSSPELSASSRGHTASASHQRSAQASSSGGAADPSTAAIATAAADSQQAMSVNHGDDSRLLSLSADSQEQQQQSALGSAQSAAAAADLVAGVDFDDSEGGVSTKTQSEQSWKDYFRWLFASLVSFLSRLLTLLWRLLELHLNRLVLLIIVIVCISDISAFNIVALAFVLLTLLIPGLNSLSLLFFNIWALFSIQAKMAFQLDIINAQDLALNNDCKANVSRFRTLGEWTGVRKVTNLPAYIQGYLWVMVLISLRVVVRRHQRAVKERYRLSLQQAHSSAGSDGGDSADEIEPPPEGTHLFSNVRREDADSGVTQALKYLCNHGFELFGMEMTFLVCGIVIVVRQDIFALLYSIFLVVLLLSSVSERLLRYFMWPVFTVCTALFLLTQYFLLLGLPPSLCYRTFWQTNNSFDSNEGLLHWMFLSVPNVRQNKWFPLGDFFLLVSASIQLHNFRLKRSIHSGSAAPSGYQAVQEQVYAVPDFTDSESWLDFFKRFIFHHMFWLTLAIMFVAATTRTSVLSLGYMVLSFLFLWYGGSQLLLRKDVLLRRWRLLLAYNVMVIVVKTALQAWSCAFMGTSSTDVNIGKLFATSCHHPILTNATATNSDRQEDQTGLYLDCVLLAMLLLQLRVFSSPYFTHVVNYLDMIVEFAPDGLRMRLRLQHHRRKARRDAERSNLTKIRDRVLQLEKEPHSFQTLYGGTIIPKVVSQTDLDGRRLSGSSGVSDTSGSLSLDAEDTSLETGGGSGVRRRRHGDDGRGLSAFILDDTDVTAAGDRSDAAQSVEPTDDETGLSETEDDLVDGAEEGRSGQQRRHRRHSRKPTSQRSFLQKVWYAVNDFLSKSVVFWLDEISFDYLFVETRLRRLRHLRVLQRLRDQGQDIAGSNITADDCAPPGTVLATPISSIAAARSTAAARKRSQRPPHDTEEEEDSGSRRTRTSTRATTDLLTAADGPQSGVHAISPASDSDQGAEEAAGASAGRDSRRLRKSKLGPLSALDFILKERSLGIRLQATEKLLRSEIADVVYMPARLSWALYYALLARTDLFCYFLMIVDHVVNGQLLTMPLPILVFMWALLEKPRPSRRFWVLAIAYVEIVVVLKFVFQSTLWNEAKFGDGTEPLNFFQLSGLYRVPDFTKAAVVDILLLLALCFHRGMLRLQGLWEFNETRKQDGEKGNGEEEEEEEGEAGEGEGEGGDEGAGVVALAETSRSKLPRQHLSFAAPGDGRDGIDAAGEAVDGGDGSVRFSIEGRQPVKPATTEDSALTRTVRFFRTALDPRRGSGQGDYYVVMIFADIIAFLISIFSYSSFAERSSGTNGNVVSYIQSNHLPKTFLILMLVQFLAIIVDRVIYLRKWLVGKLIFQVLLLFVVHGWLFFLLPYVSGRAFRNNPAAQAWYFFKCLYFAMSARQIAAGYPTRILSHFLTKKPSLITAVLFIGFQAIPFLLELRGLLDWACTDTVLSLMYWFKVEDIRASIYVIKSFRDDERDDPRPLGAKVSAIVKLLVGGLGVTAIIVVLWLPLILISLVNSVSIPNLPYSGSVTAQIIGYEPLFHFTGEELYIKDLSVQDYNTLKDQFPPDVGSTFTPFAYSDVKAFLVPSRSGSIWTISPPARATLEQELSNNATNLQVAFHWSFKRHPGTGLAAESVSGSVSRPITDLERATLYAILNGNRNLNASFAGLFPAYVDAPGNGQSRLLKDLIKNRPVSVSLRLDSTNNSLAAEQWWSLFSQTPPILNTSLVNDKSFVQMFVFSNKITPPQFSFLAGQGIIGLYLSLVLVIGQFLRLFFTNISHRIVYEDLPNPDTLHSMCKDILLVRESKRLSLEERLVGQLFLIYRNPVHMIELTREKPIIEKEKRD